MGSVQKGRFVPEHHLFTAFGALCTNREELTLADPRTVEYLSGREVEARTAADGWCCVTVDGWPLGGGKVSGGQGEKPLPQGAPAVVKRSFWQKPENRIQGLNADG